MAPSSLPLPNLNKVKKKISKSLENRKILKETHKDLKRIDSKLKEIEKELKELES
jgi:hypothetical protein